MPTCVPLRLHFRAMQNPSSEKERKYIEQDGFWLDCSKLLVSEVKFILVQEEKNECEHDGVHASVIFNPPK